MNTLKQLRRASAEQSLVAAITSRLRSAVRAAADLDHSQRVDPRHYEYKGPVGFLHEVREPHRSHRPEEIA